MKSVGKPDAVIPHLQFDVAGAGLPPSRDYFNGQKDEVLLNSLVQALDQRQAEYGTSDMSQWKKEMETQPFSPSFMGIPTSGGTIDVIPIYMNRGITEHLVELTQPFPFGVNILPPGESGFIDSNQVASPYFDDQVDLYVNWEYKDMYFTLEDVQQYLTSETFLQWDFDGDGISENGDNSGPPGDNPCTGGETENCDDNCPDTPNGLDLGTCTKGTMGEVCISDGDCGTSGFCSMDQEDTYPPGGNGCGDACECEADFNGDHNVDAYDNVTFNADYGRNLYNNPCTNENPCSGDFNCDSNVDSYDNVKFNEDFGRNIYNNPCPLCPTEPWCVY